MAAKLIYRNRIVAVLFILFGLVMLFFSACLPFLLKSPALGFTLMGVPLIFGAVTLLLHGTAAALTRIEITENGLKLSIPGWRAFPVPPVRRASLSWDGVLAVRNRTEIYHVTVLPIALAMSFPVNVFALDTTMGRFVLGGRIRWLPKAMEQIARRAGRSIQFEGEIDVKMFRTLLHGPPEWQPFYKTNNQQ